MLIKNNLSKQITVLLNGESYVFGPDTIKEVPDTEGKFILRLQPLLQEIKTETVVVHSEPEEIVTEEKVKKNVVKNKKSRK